MDDLELTAIDEINIGKGRYLTVLLNLKTGVIVFVGEGKGSSTLEPFWERFKRKKNIQIKAVAIDMSSAYIKAVTENLPDAKIMFDHFHVIKLFNEKPPDFISNNALLNRGYRHCGNGHSFSDSHKTLLWIME